MQKTIIFHFIFLLLFSCSKDEKVQPVDILSSNPELQEMQARSESIEDEIKITIGETRKEIEKAIRKEMENAQRAIKEEIEKAQEQAKIEILTEQREVNFELMKYAEIEDPQKIRLASKYFALLDFQFRKDGQNYEMESVQAFLSESNEFFPDLSYTNIHSNGGFIFPSQIKIEDKSFKHSMNKKSRFNLFALSIAMDIINPENPRNKSFYDLIIEGLGSDAGEVYETGHKNANELIMANADKFIFLLQLRHNALYNAVIASLDETPFSFFKRYTVTGEGMSLEFVQTLMIMLKSADKTKLALKDLGVSPIDYKKRVKKLKRISLKLSDELDPKVAKALSDLNQYILK